MQLSENHLLIYFTLCNCGASPCWVCVYKIVSYRIVTDLKMIQCSVLWILKCLCSDEGSCFESEVGQRRENNTHTRPYKESEKHPVTVSCERLRPLYRVTRGWRWTRSTMKHLRCCFNTQALNSCALCTTGQVCAHTPTHPPYLGPVHRGQSKPARLTEPKWLMERKHTSSKCAGKFLPQFSKSVQ